MLEYYYWVNHPLLGTVLYAGLLVWVLAGLEWGMFEFFSSRHNNNDDDDTPLGGGGALSV